MRYCSSGEFPGSGRVPALVLHPPTPPRLLPLVSNREGPASSDTPAVVEIAILVRRVHLGSGHMPAGKVDFRGLGQYETRFAPRELQ